MPIAKFVRLSDGSVEDAAPNENTHDEDIDIVFTDENEDLYGIYPKDGDLDTWQYYVGWGTIDQGHVRITDPESISTLKWIWEFRKRPDQLPANLRTASIVLPKSMYE